MSKTITHISFSRYRELALLIPKARIFIQEEKIRPFEPGKSNLKVTENSL